MQRRKIKKPRTNKRVQKKEQEKEKKTGKKNWTKEQEKKKEERKRLYHTILVLFHGLNFELWIVDCGLVSLLSRCLSL